MIRAALAGASGFVGGELMRLCAMHPHIEVTRAFGDSRAGKPVAEAHPHLALAYRGMQVDSFDEHALAETDLLFLALPHGHSQRIASTLVGLGIKIVDLGADFRLSSADDYAYWYKEEHGAPGLLDRFVYGIPELHRDAIATSDCVAAAGCYPTAAILALKPLVDAGLVERSSIVVDASSGVSGAGRALKDSSHFNAVAESLSAYGLLDHRHTAELEEALGATVLFTPHLAPMNRGILATCYGTAAKPMHKNAPLECLREAYRDEPFIHVSEAAPSTKWTLGSNAVHLTARFDERTGRVLAIAALDNLVKGAAGQMIQCANLMFGLPETAGLPVAGVYP